MTKPNKETQTKIETVQNIATGDIAKAREYAEKNGLIV